MDVPSEPRPRAAAIVHRIHDRYLLEVVEALNLCPFARRSRELGRVHRPVLWIEGRHPRPEDAAARLQAVVEASPDAEIVLLTFVERVPDRFAAASTFDRFVEQVRTSYQQLDAPTFFMVGFHPQLGRTEPDEPERPLTRDTLVPIIRRSPDPVIQCVNADVLERARAQAQTTAHERLVASMKHDPVLYALIQRSVQPDPQLSAEIGRNNFDAVGAGEGFAELDRRLQDILRARDEAYAQL